MDPWPFWVFGTVRHPGLSNSHLVGSWHSPPTKTRQLKSCGLLAQSAHQDSPTRILCTLATVRPAGPTISDPMDPWHSSPLQASPTQSALQGSPTQILSVIPLGFLRARWLLPDRSVPVVWMVLGNQPGDESFAPSGMRIEDACIWPSFPTRLRCTLDS